MLPDLPSLKKDIQWFLTRYLRSQINARLGVFNKSPKLTAFEGNRMRTILADGTVNDSEFREASTEIVVKVEEVPRLTIEERLISRDSWRGDVRQGYLSTDKERIVRVRVEGRDAWLTIKGKSVGASQEEFEHPIPVEDANKILSRLCKDFIIEKTRYTINVAGYVWEVDEFKGLNKGLVIAEIEANDEMQLEDALKSKPAWVGDDITSRYEFRNSNLSQHPFSYRNKQEVS